MSRRVAITGIGCISCYGLGVDKLYESVCDGRPYIEQMHADDRDPRFQTCPKIDLQRELRFRNLGRYRKIAQYTVASVKEALDMANAKGEPVDRSKIGLSYGTSNGPASATQEIYDSLLTQGPGSVKPRVFQESVFNSPASLASILFKFTGPISVTPNSLCAAAYAILQAQLMLAGRNIEGVMVVCSEEACVAVQKALRQFKYIRNDDSLTPSEMPDSAEQSGCVMSEGSAAIFLEPMERAIARGTKILAELEGVGCANDGHRLAKNDSSGIGLQTAIHSAERDACSYAKPDAIFSGSSCTYRDDFLEQNALRRVYGDGCPDLHSSRGVLGLAMGVSAAFDVILSVLSLNFGRMPATRYNFRRSPEIAPETFIDTMNTRSRILVNSIGINGLYGAVFVKGAA